MLKLIFCLVVFVVASWWCNWLDSFHLTVGCVFVTCMWQIAERSYAFWNRSSDESLEDEDTEPEPDPIVRRVVVATFSALVSTGVDIVLLWFAVFPLCERMEIYHLWMDGDIPGLAQHDEILEGRRLPRSDRCAGKPTRTPDIARIACPAGSAIVQRPYRRGRARQTLDARIAPLSRACAIAKAHGFDGQLGEELLTQAKDLDHVIRQAAKQRIEQQWRALIDTLRPRLGDRGLTGGERRRLALLLCDALLASAHECGTLGQEVAILKEALSLAEANQIPAVGIQKRLEITHERKRKAVAAEELVRGYEQKSQWSRLTELADRSRREIPRSDWSIPWDRCRHSTPTCAWRIIRRIPRNGSANTKPPSRLPARRAPRPRTRGNLAEWRDEHTHGARCARGDTRGSAQAGRMVERD